MLNRATSVHRLPCRIVECEKTERKGKSARNYPQGLLSGAPEHNSHLRPPRVSGVGDELHEFSVLVKMHVLVVPNIDLQRTWRIAFRG